jgi:hypothetical protein
VDGWEDWLWVDESGVGARRWAEACGSESAEEKREREGEVFDTHETDA